MFTQCPKCSTVFRVGEDQVARHKGLVRCGACRETFNAAWNEVKNLSDVRARPIAPPAEALRPAPLRAPAAAAATPPVKKEGAKLWKPLPPLSKPTRPAGPPPEAAVPEPLPLALSETRFDAVPVLPPEPVVESPPTSPERELRLPGAEEKRIGYPPPVAALPDEEPDTVEEIVLESRDNFWDKADQSSASVAARPRAGTRAASVSSTNASAPAPLRRQRTLAWGVAAVVLLVIAVWQIGFFYFDTLAQSPTARPIIEALCSVFRCQVPARRQLSKIDVAGATVAYHEEIPGALKISVNLINRAPFPQTEPTLQVTLTDKNAKVVGRRAYKAEEYRRERALLAPNVVTLVTLELAAPPEAAVGYEIELFD